MEVVLSSPYSEVEKASLQDKYVLRGSIGSGTFGTVSLAHGRQDNKLVAVKTLKKSYACPPTQLREVQFYLYVPAHENLIDLKEMFVDACTQQIHFVTGLMDINLLELIKGRYARPLSVAPLVSIFTQLVRGLAHIHAHGFIHRDLKPENILISTSSCHFNFTVKIADFGLARRAASNHECHKWTSYVATRWYRAPEQLLGVPYHSFPLDIWALGTLIVELCNLAPLFPGQDTVDMVRRQLKVLGTPSVSAPGGYWDHNFVAYTELKPILSVRHRGIKPSALMRHPEGAPFAPLALQCLQWDPKQRPELKTILAELKSIPQGSTSRHVRSFSVG